MALEFSTWVYDDIPKIVGVATGSLLDKVSGEERREPSTHFRRETRRLQWKGGGCQSWIWKRESHFCLDPYLVTIFPCSESDGSILCPTALRFDDETPRAGRNRWESEPFHSIGGGGPQNWICIWFASWIILLRLWRERCQLRCRLSWKDWSIEGRHWSMEKREETREERKEQSGRNCPLRSVKLQSTAKWYYNYSLDIYRFVSSWYLLQLIESVTTDDYDATIRAIQSYLTQHSMHDQVSQWMNY